MLNKYLNLTKQDLTILMRNNFHLIVIGLAVIMVILVNFVIPGQVKITPKELFFDNTNNNIVQDYLLKNDVQKDRFVDSEKKLYERLNQNSNTLGVIIDGNKDNTSFTIIGQGNENDEAFNLLSAAMANLIDRIKNNQNENINIQYLRPQQPNIPFNQKLIPIIIFTEVILLGFLLVAVIVFQEKEEGGIKAFRVSPANTIVYILSKVSANLILAYLYLLIVLLFTLGFNVNYLNIFVLTTLGSILMTLLGLSISVFFKNLEEFIFVALIVLSILALPMMTYLTPSFSPDFFRFLPSYSVLFGLRELLFTSGKNSILFNLNMLLVLEGIGMFIIATWSVNRKLMKEGK